ncbi:MAG TPA: hypothetical protein VIW29_17810 [Polyangiaceae bacterium]
MEPKQGQDQSFYRWIDGEGRVHIVSSLASVPEADRPKAAVVLLNGTDSLGEYPTLDNVTSFQPQWPSFAAGFGVALLLVLVYRLLPNGLRGVTRWAIVLGAAVLLTGAYLGYVRRSTGVAGAGALASPNALLDDAKSAVERMNKRQAEQQRQLQEIEAETR